MISHGDTLEVLQDYINVLGLYGSEMMVLRENLVRKEAPEGYFLVHHNKATRKVLLTTTGAAWGLVLVDGRWASVRKQIERFRNDQRAKRASMSAGGVL